MASQMEPQGCRRAVLIGWWAVQDGLGIVLVRSFFRLAIRDHFFWPLGRLLESFWGVFGLVLSYLGLSWARFWALRVAFWNPITLYAHQLINASTLQPVPRQHFATRAGGLRAERLNNVNKIEQWIAWTSTCFLMLSGVSLVFPRCFIELRRNTVEK